VECGEDAYAVYEQFYASIDDNYNDNQLLDGSYESLSRGTIQRNPFYEALHDRSAPRNAAYGNADGLYDELHGVGVARQGYLQISEEPYDVADNASMEGDEVYDRAIPRNDPTYELANHPDPSDELASNTDATYELATMRDPNYGLATNAGPTYELASDPGAAYEFASIPDPTYELATSRDPACDRPPTTEPTYIRAGQQSRVSSPQPKIAETRHAAISNKAYSPVVRRGKSQ